VSGKGSGRTVRVVLAWLAAMCAVLGAAAPAVAETPVQRAEVIMRQTYAEFAETAQNREPPFDWTTDGCSGRAIPNIGDWKGVFHRACVQHDFGYRNFGGRGELKLDPTESRRLWIDDRFLTEMTRICSDGGYGPLSPCLGTAYTIHSAVRAAGGTFF
jgi:hypothetical protein